MSKLPMANFKTMDKILRRLGFTAVRQKGSHVFYRHPDGRTTTLPDHGNRDIALTAHARDFAGNIHFSR